MKRPILWIAVFFVAGIEGCSSSSQPNAAPGNFDPVLQVTPLVGTFQYENGQKFDVGIAFFRAQSSDGTQLGNDFTTARMAFATHGYPAQVSAAIINGVTLQWFPDAASSQSNMYAKDDSNAYGAPDSMTFSYQGFGGESFASTAAIAPSFGKIIFPDTASAALGCAFSYQNPVPGDSITVSIVNDNPPDTITIPSIHWTIPDTGGFTIKPQQLSYNSNYSRVNDYTVAIYRYHWTVVSSPNGKRIGMYSEQDVIFDFLVKP